MVQLLAETGQLSLYHNCDSTTIRLRLRQIHFLLASNGSRRAIRRSRIVVVSQLDRTHIVISIISVVVECVVVSSYTTYRSLVVVESQLQSRLYTHGRCSRHYSVCSMLLELNLPSFDTLLINSSAVFNQNWIASE